MTIALTDHDDGGRIQARVGDTVEVRLPEIASGGYRWSPDDVDSSLFELNDSGIDSQGEGIGASGHAYFHITVRAAGTGTLRLKYWRPWEGEASVQRRFAVEVVATPT
jgi:inhibitor of cysteine peptidase